MSVPDSGKYLCHANAASSSKMTAQFFSNLLFTKPDIRTAKRQLDYPLYAADFDPLNHHFLLVGGGGGSSSTGVPNKITLLDTSNRSEIKEVSEVIIPAEEDSVASLRVADSDPQSLLAYAGINSSQKDQRTGKNEHFRSFRVPLPARRKVDGGEVTVKNLMVEPVQSLARTSLFKSATGLKNECYQRVLKLSPPIVDEFVPAGRDGLEKPTKTLKRRLVTIASGLAEQNEVITFPAEESPSRGNVISRLGLEKEEANDVDLTSVDDTGSAYVLGYCTDHILNLQQLAGAKGTRNSDGIPVFETATGPQGRSKIRALRFLNSRYLLLLQNRVNRSGVELIVFKISKDYAQVQQVLVKYINNMKQAVGLDTCTLSKDEGGSQQFVVSVAGQDSSLQTYTLDYVGGRGMTPFKQYADFVDVHSGPITKISFSNFISPSLPITGDTPPQYIRLATVGVDKQVIVQTLPLRPSPATGSGKTRPRYVLVAASQFGSTLYSLFVGFAILILGLSVVLAFLELRGAIPPIIGTTRFLPQRWQEQYGRSYPYAHDNPGPVIPESMPAAAQSVIDRIKLSEATPIIEKLEEIQDRAKLAAATPIIEQMQEMQSSIPSLETVQDTLVGLVSHKSSNDEHTDKAVIVRDAANLGGELSAEMRHEAEIVKEGTLKRWEHLTQEDQRTWKQKLKDAGHWTEQQGETVLKGVFFGQLAGIVGNMVGG
ncbi:hypothetical protein LTR05_000226 [Lithohypha guttulata]|uniref:Guanine nucleotide-exchange factor SEC12 n=1 Tax=Lithohypha guttulata TaxID=1690604 RepID=A0AAN7Y975_9EURO|nr:hypothetical protein LTR05_000226 [Lithohypha guttulata]